MKFYKILKELMIFLPIMTIISCSLNKDLKSDRSGKNTLSTRNAAMIFEENESEGIHTEKVHKNNIIYFDFNKNDIRSEFSTILDNHAALLCKKPFYKITIEGHADERGTPEYNISLGERRANAIKAYFQNKGISSDRIFIVSYGKEKPAVLGHYEEAYAKNRRAVIVY